MPLTGFAKTPKPLSASAHGSKREEPRSSSTKQLTSRRNLPSDTHKPRIRPNESLGMRTTDLRPKLSPVPDARDIGRRPLKGFGRVDIQRVMPDPQQPRTEFDEDAISSLAANIKVKGQLHPIHVRWSEDSRKWIIISGERRWRAATHAGLATVDCFFHESALTSGQVLELQLIENLLREDLRPIEQAKAFQSLMELNHWNGKQLAESLRIPASTVSRSLALLSLPSDVQRQVDTGEIAARTAYELSRLTDDEDRRELVTQSATGNLTNSQAAVAVRQKPTKRAPNPRPSAKPSTPKTAATSPSPAQRHPTTTTSKPPCNRLWKKCNSESKTEFSYSRVGIFGRDSDPRSNLNFAELRRSGRSTRATHWSVATSVDMTEAGCDHSNMWLRTVPSTHLLISRGRWCFSRGKRAVRSN